VKHCALRDASLEKLVEAVGLRFCERAVPSYERAPRTVPWSAFAQAQHVTQLHHRDRLDRRRQDLSVGITEHLWRRKEGITRCLERRRSAARGVVQDAPAHTCRSPEGRTKQPREHGSFI